MKPPSLTSIIFLSLTLESSAFAPKPSTRVPVVAVNQLSRLDDARVGQSVRLYAEGGGNPFQTLLGGFLKPKEVEPVEPEKPKIPDFVADPSKFCVERILSFLPLPAVLCLTCAFTELYYRLPTQATV